MTKKINAILFSLLLVIPTFGVSLEKHFCGGKLADVALFTGAGCGCDEADENDDCCREEDEVYQMNLKQFLRLVYWPVSNRQVLKIRLALSSSRKFLILNQ